jgi:hypothetical protein
LKTRKRWRGIIAISLLSFAKAGANIAKIEVTTFLFFIIRTRYIMGAAIILANMIANKGVINIPKIAKKKKYAGIASAIPITKIIGREIIPEI